MKAKKENKVYAINSEQEKQRYLKEGYDIYDDEGNVQTHSPMKKILYSEYVKAVKEIEDLKAEIAELQTAKKEPEKKETAKKAETEKAGE